MASSTGTSTWKPHEGQWTETPLPFMKYVPRAYYRVRWLCWYPLQWRLPFCFLTLGELLFTAVLFAVAGRMAQMRLYDNNETGELAAGFTALAWTFAARNSAWTFLAGIPFERALWWHKLTAYMSVALGLMHGITSYWPRILYTDDSGSSMDPLAGSTTFSGRKLLNDEVEMTTGQYNTTGWALMGSMLGLIATSALPQLRRYAFNFFYYMHWALFLMLSAAALLHQATGVWVGVGCWLADIAIRFIWMAGIKHPHKATLQRLPGDIVKVSFPRGSIRYSAGQYMFLCIPELSLFEWHPFSISSNQHDGEVHLHVRVLGDWTRQLYRLATIKGGNFASEVDAYLEGPYGSPTIDLLGDRYKALLLVSGGIGITPVQALFNELLQQAARGRGLKRLALVWSVRDKYLVDSVLEYDKESFLKATRQLPHSFSPDLVSHTTQQFHLTAASASLRRSGGAAVQPQPPSPTVTSEFYLTQVRPQAGYLDANIKPELQPFLRFGRPDFEAVFSMMKRDALAAGEQRVAVVVCGPVSMVDSVRQFCNKYSGGGVAFHLYAEVFEF